MPATHRRTSVRRLRSPTSPLRPRPTPTRRSAGCCRTPSPAPASCSNTTVRCWTASPTSSPSTRRSKEPSCRSTSTGSRRRCGRPLAAGSAPRASATMPSVSTDSRAHAAAARPSAAEQIRMRVTRLILTAAIAGTVVATGVGASVQAAPRQPCGGRVHDAGNGWQGIRPSFTLGGPRVVQVVATPYVPDRMYATNGKQVLQTDNAGCDWHPAGPSVQGGTLGLLPPPVDGLLRIPSTGTIVGIAAPSSATATDRVYVAWNDKSALGTTRPHITYLDSTGNWREGSGLPRFGSIGDFDIAASPTVPTNAYAVVDPELGGKGGIYYTPDGGQTWLQRDPSQRSATLRGLRVDPAVNTWLYGIGSTGLVASSDGGASFQPRHSGSDITSYDVAPGAGSSMLVVGHDRRKTFDRSNDGGTSWSPFHAPIFTHDVAMQPILDQVAVSDGSRVFLESLAGAGSSRNVTPGAGAPFQLQLTAPSSSGYAIVGMRGNTVLRTVKNLANETVRIGNPAKPIVL